MRKSSLMFALLFSGAIAYGQVRPITGQVRDAKGNPVPFASVKVKGSSKGVSADKDGNFKIDAEGDAVLEFSAISFESFEVAVGSQTVLGVTLQTKEGLSEVVVTALGVKRNKNTLPYAAQQLKGDEITSARSGNVGAALSGKVSGVQIQQGNSIGGSTNVVIRGQKSLTKSNQALFVVDGVPIDNSNTNSANQQTGRGGYDYGNAAADINPDDIESMNVLKGAAASALYGSRAANGVIMITTKKGKRGLGVTVNSGVTYGSIDKDTYAKYQDKYGAGYAYDYGAPAPDAGFLYFDVDGDGVKDRVVPTTEDASYGQAFNPNLMVYHWDAFDPTSPNYMKARPWVAAKNKPTEFFENPFSTNNSIMLDGANDKGNFKIGYTRNDEKGVLPNSRVTKNIINFGSSYNLTNKLTVSAAVNFSKIDGTGRYGTGYDNLNINQNFRQWYQTNMDVLEQKAAYDRTGQNITWNWKDPNSPAGLVPIYTDNPYFMRHESYSTDTRNRVFGNVALNYKLTDYLNLMGRVSLDTYDELQEERNAVGSVDPASYSRYTRHFHELNYDLMANFDRDLNQDFNLKALAGVNMRRSLNNSELAATNGGLVVPKLYSLSNSKNPITAPLEAYNPIAVDGYFGGVTLGFRDFLTLDGTFRRDRSSTLPVDNNAYNYFSTSGSWLFSHHLKDLNWLSFGKLRVNYAEVGSDAPWGNIKDVYEKPAPFGNGILFTLPNTKNNNNLKPERTKSKEIGLEMAFLKNRIGFDVSYYITNTIDQIIPVSVSTATGYSSKIMNAGNVENRGIELSLYATPVKTRDFSWNVNLNWTRNRNEVLSLYEDSKNLPLASYQGGVSVNATLGQPYGTIQGKTWVLLDGQRVVDDVPLLASGKPNPNYGRYKVTTTTNNVIGNVNPDWIGGMYNTFKYKNISLGFLIDVKKGGDVFSLDMYYGLATGIYPETAGLNDKGNPSRDAVADGGGLIFPGVKPDGKPNDIRVENIYGTYGYSFNPAHNFVYDASYVKLRELNLTYTFPASVVSKLGPVKGIDLSLIGRNLWIIHKNLPYADPEENLSSGNAQGYQSGAYPTTRQIGVNAKLKF